MRGIMCCWWHHHGAQDVLLMSSGHADMHCDCICSLKHIYCMLRKAQPSTQHQVSKVVWGCWAHDARRPCAILTCTTPQHHAPVFHICLVPCAPSKVFKLPRLAPQRNSVRGVAGGVVGENTDAMQGDDAALPATPVYNQGIVMVGCVVGEE